MDLSDFTGGAEYVTEAAVKERKSQRWLKCACAFANGDGGAIVFGVADDGTAVGLDDADLALDKIPRIVKSKLEPAPKFEQERRVLDGRDIIVMKIPGGQMTPCYYMGEGGRVAYVRAGGESVPAGAGDMRRLLMDGADATYDMAASPYMMSELSFSEFCAAYRAKAGAELTASDFVFLSLADETGRATNAGALFADGAPVPNSRLTCALWSGLDKTSGEAREVTELGGSLLSLLQGGMDFVKGHTKTVWRNTVAGKAVIPEYPSRAVKEALLNALIHRDHTRPDGIRLDIFDDRMEISSPGGMVDGSAVQELDPDLVASKRRGPVLADIMWRMRFTDRRGGGLVRICAEYRRSVNYRDELRPRFKSAEGDFLVTLYNLNYYFAIDELMAGRQSAQTDSDKVLFAPDDYSIRVAIDSLSASRATKDKIRLLYGRMGMDSVFDLNEISKVIGASENVAMNIVIKLKKAGAIKTVKVYGRNKYAFKNPGK